MRKILTIALIGIFSACFNANSPLLIDSEITARVDRINLAAIWDHYDSGSFDSFDSVDLIVSDPPSMAGQKITVNLQGQAAPFWRKGLRCQFLLTTSKTDEIYLSNLQELSCEDL